jgi:hypothetical protein
VLSAGAAFASGLGVEIRKLIVIPQQAVVTGALPGDFVLRTRRAPSVAPAGGALTVISWDSQDAVPAGLTAHNGPSTAPSGGTALDIFAIPIQGDEVKLTTLDAPTMAAVRGGIVLYEAQRGCKPLTIRTNETLELQQGATAGTGNVRVFCHFCVGA